MVFLRAKCIVAGESAVGKSTICQAFQNDGSHASKNYVMTTGLQLLSKSINLSDKGNVVEFYLYDSAGKDVFFDFVSAQWHNPSMCIVVYDVTDRTSYDGCEKYIKKIKSLAGNAVLPGVLLGNKSDLTHRRSVSEIEGKELAQQHSLSYFECSATDWKSIETVFMHLAETFSDLQDDKENHINTLP